jgi:hypothetical protein
MEHWVLFRSTAGTDTEANTFSGTSTGKAEIRLLGKDNSNAHGARPVLDHLKDKVGQ